MYLYKQSHFCWLKRTFCKFSVTSIRISFWRLYSLSIKKKNIMWLHFKLLVSWQCLATCCQVNTVLLHVARSTLLSHMLPGWHCRWSLTWDMRVYDIQHNHLFQAYGHFFTKKKKNPFKIEIKMHFKNILTQNNLGFYRTNIDNLGNWGEKWLDIYWSYLTD